MKHLPLLIFVCGVTLVCYSILFETIGPSTMACVPNYPSKITDWNIEGSSFNKYWLLYNGTNRNSGESCEMWRRVTENVFNKYMESRENIPPLVSFQGR